VPRDHREKKVFRVSKENLEEESHLFQELLEMAPLALMIFILSSLQITPARLLPYTMALMVLMVKKVKKAKKVMMDFPLVCK
jgi:hypothetical protein